nr:immunoglobulin heavy chain junction region [Macaca mulatta]MOW50724.1 immunoglobulin heavy chain junction region [Macaca mulatta]
CVRVKGFYINYFDHW